MKVRSNRQLRRMHHWTHRRLHNAQGKHFRYWLDVRTKLQHLLYPEAQP